METLNDLKTHLFKDEAVKKAYDEWSLHYELLEALIMARTEQGITQTELAKRTGISKSNISRFEKGTHSPSIDFVQRIAKGLNKTISFTMQDIKK